MLWVSRKSLTIDLLKIIRLTLINTELNMNLNFASKFIQKLSITVLVAFAINACGGGGGSTPEPAAPKDSTDPVVSLNGDATVTLQQGTIYNDPGANATDNIDGSISATTSDTVGTAVGTYILVYSATDKAGNSSSVQRTVHVVADPAAIAAINSSKWFQQTKLPNGSSWFNGEQQHYTDRIENAYVSNGTLKIVAKKETYRDQNVTKSYTSARLNSKYAFQYGTVEVRAKLPSGMGTWPAIWTLGKNINETGAYWQTQGYGTTSWPATGEIDIMEHWGSDENFVQSAIHTPSSSGNTGNKGGQTIATATSQFHVYKLEWTAQQMVFSVDDIVHYTYAPEEKNLLTWPFDAEQYLLLNFAIEQNIYSGFTEDELEVDYVRIYDQNAVAGDAPVWSDEFDGGNTGDSANTDSDSNGEAEIPSDTGYYSAESYSGYSLTWSDEFSGNALNQTDWNYETGAGGWGNNELQYHRPDNTSVSDGVLIIEAREENFGGASYTSSRITTQNKKFFRYGRIDIRARLPQGQGLWPALWMLGQNFSSVGWPASGEIDIMEMIGGSGREDTVHAHTWWSNNGQTADYGGSLALAAGETLANSFHVFSLEWSAQSIIWYIDDVQFHVIDITPAGLAAFQEEFFFIFNVAVGGNWPGSPNASTIFPQRMLVDYIRVFQQN
jgi:beta-glucanase (GH16 family)